MSDNNLVKSPVVFNEFEHTYTYNGVQFSGVTSLLSRTLFQDKYLGVDFNVLEEARQRGTLIHEQIELYESLGATPEGASETLDVYRKLKADAFSDVKLLHVTTEYLVSNLDGLATMADLVYEYETRTTDRQFCLLDIKTTSQLDIKYLQWQLSIEAYLFELQNPGCKVVDLSCVWLPKPQYGQPKIVDVDRVPTSEVLRLIEADKNAEEFIPEAEYDTFEFRDPTIDLDELIELRLQKEEIESQIELMLEAIKDEMDENRRYSIRHTSNRNFQTIAISNKQDTTRVGVDSNLLKEKYPEVYKDVSKISRVKGSISLRML